MCISYIGGKNMMAKWIGHYIPKDVERYSELFSGAFWVYMKNDFVFDEIYYNDFNKFMCNIFACAKEPKNFLIELEKYPVQDRKLFNSFRDEINELMKTNNFQYPNFDIGAKYVYLVTQVFSGIMGKTISMVKTDGHKYKSFIRKMRNHKVKFRLNKITDILNESYEKIIERFDSKGFFAYCDPPYFKTENYYINHNFNINEHKKLISMLKSMKGRWALSYYEFPDLKKWLPEDKYKWVRKDFVKMSARIKVNGKKNKGTELLIMNYEYDLPKYK